MRSIVVLYVLCTFCSHALHVGRRGACTGAIGALVCSPQHAAAAAKGGVQWSIDLPPSFQIQRQLSSIVRIKTEQVLLADDPATGAQAKLLLLPFGQQAGGSLTADEQLGLADFFFGATKADELTTGAERISATMTASASRSPGITSLARIGAPAASTNEGRRYVQYAYAAERCNGELDSGICYGDVSKRRTLATVTMSSISQFRTNTERERMKEMGQTRNVEVLWLLTFSAPDGAFEQLRSTFERASASFFVPLAEE